MINVFEVIIKPEGYIISQEMNEHLEGGHNAEIDVIATEKCFNKLCEFGVITL